MPPFRFRLQPILDHRTRVESTHRRTLLGAERALTLEQAALLSLEGELLRLGRVLREECARPSAMTARGTLIEVDFVRSALAAQQRVVRRCADAVEDARAAFASARQDQKQIQSLRDRQDATFQAADERREASEHDEANIGRNTISP